MVTYIYFVKCPNCEDEHFDFFDDAKAFAMGCISQKPIITQTEVCRNDFGECTDSSDLGQVWSWEDEVGEPEDEPATFSKDDFKSDYDPDNDPEFQDDDFFAINAEEPVVAPAEDSKEPITEAKTDPFHEAIFEAIEYLTEFNDIFPVPENIGADTWKELKDDINYGLSSDFEIAEIIMEYLDKDLAISRKHPEMFEDDPQSELTLETYNRLKRAYDRAVAAYEAEHAEDFEESCRKPIPEGMTIEELVEEMEENEDTVECTWCNELFDKSECRKEVDLGWLCSRCEMAIKSRGETLTFREGNYWDFLDEKLDLDIDFSQVVDSSDMEIWGVESAGENTYKAVLLKRFENVPFRGGRDEIEKVESEMFDLGGLFVFHFGKDGLPRLGRWDPELLNSLGNCEIIFDDERYDRAAEETLNGSASKREVLESEELHDLGNTYDGGYPEKQTWVCYYNGNDLGTVEAATEEEAYLKMEQTWPEYNFNNEDVQVIPANEDDDAFDLDFPEV